MKHIMEVHPQWKMGHAQIKTKMAIIGRNIVRIESLTEEIPDFADGINARLIISSGEQIPVTDKYEDLLEEWNRVLENEL